MKLQYKAFTLIILLGVIITTLLTTGFNHYNHSAVIEKETMSRAALSEEIASHLESHINEKCITTQIIASAPLIKKRLKKSNTHYSKLSDNTRKKEIGALNKRWMNTKELDAPFIQSHITNEIGQFFQLQQVLQPGDFGEIFLTNRYPCGRPLANPHFTTVPDDPEMDMIDFLSTKPNTVVVSNSGRPQGRIPTVWWCIFTVI